jgi:hypothetical protein
VLGRISTVEREAICQTAARQAALEAGVPVDASKAAPPTMNGAV